MKAGFWEIILIIILIMVLFGHSKIPDMMKNIANGINVFKKELKSDDGKAEGKGQKAEKSVVVKKPASAKKATPRKVVAKKSAAKKK